MRRNATPKRKGIVATPTAIRPLVLDEGEEEGVELNEDEVIEVVDKVTRGGDAWIELYEAAGKARERRESSKLQGRFVMEMLDKQMSFSPRVSKLPKGHKSSTWQRPPAAAQPEFQHTPTISNHAKAKTPDRSIVLRLSPSRNRPATPTSSRANKEPTYRPVLTPETNRLMAQRKALQRDSVNIHHKLHGRHVEVESTKKTNEQKKNRMEDATLRNKPMLTDTTQDLMMRRVTERDVHQRLFENSKSPVRGRATPTTPRSEAARGAGMKLLDIDFDDAMMEMPVSKPEPEEVFPPRAPSFQLKQKASPPPGPASNSSSSTERQSLPVKTLPQKTPSKVHKTERTPTPSPIPFTMGNSSSEDEDNDSDFHSTEADTIPKEPEFPSASATLPYAAATLPLAAATVPPLRFDVGAYVVCDSRDGPLLGQILQLHDNDNAYSVITAHGELRVKEDTVKDGGRRVRIAKQNGILGIVYKGTTVLDVAPDTPAAGAIRVGSVIVAIQDTVVTTHGELAQALERAPNKGQFDVNVILPELMEAGGTLPHGPVPVKSAFKGTRPAKMPPSLQSQPVSHSSKTLLSKGAPPPPPRNYGKSPAEHGLLTKGPPVVTPLSSAASQPQKGPIKTSSFHRNAPMKASLKGSAKGTGARRPPQLDSPSTPPHPSPPPAVVRRPKKVPRPRLPPPV